MALCSLVPDLATSVPNIYAVGDCAACRDGSLRTSSLKVADLEIAAPA